MDAVSSLNVSRGVGEAGGVGGGGGVPYQPDIFKNWAFLITSLELSSISLLMARS